MRSPLYLNALRAFEATARHGSFSEAAAELNVTPAAVGQLVRSLEEWLGTPLFIRSQSGKVRLTPTEATRRSLADIRAGLDRLAMGLDRMREAATGGILTVAVSPAFASKWLLPRIDRFQAQWPDADVRLDTNLKLSDYLAQGIDIGVRYGRGQWQGLAAEKLVAEEVFPVGSPAIADALGEAPPDALASQSLIHDLSVDPALGFPTWDCWFRDAGAPVSTSQRGLKINNSAAVLQAAVEGKGVALARSLLVGDDLAAGRLVRLFPHIKVDLDLAYYVVYRPEARDLPLLRGFRDWLFAEMAGASATKV